MGRLVWLFAIVVAAALPFGGARAAEPQVQPGIDGVLTAFQTHPVVAIADWHDIEEEGAFWAALVRDPRFAQSVGNIVFEFGGASQQGIIDRYTSGEHVPYSELRSVWSNMPGVPPTTVRSMFIDFYAAVRSANAGLPAEKKIRIWLGDPTIDWSKIKTSADLDPILMRRDEFPAEIIKREILAKGKKTLVIYGAAHFRTWPGAISQSGDGIDGRVNAAYPGSVFLITPYVGFVDPKCAAPIEAKMRTWITPSLITAAKGTWLEAGLRQAGCLATNMRVPPGAKFPEGLLEWENDKASGAKADGILYLGRPDTLTSAKLNSDIYLDLDYFDAMSKRTEIMTGRPLDWADIVARNTNGPRRWRAFFDEWRATMAKAPPPARASAR